MRFAHVLSAFYFEPWNLRPDLHANFGRILQAHVSGEQVPEQIHTRREPLAAGVNRPIVGPVDRLGSPIVPQMQVSDGVAVIPVWGVLGKRMSYFDLLCGGCDYEHVAEFARMALADPGIDSVIFDFDTPGGSCRGLPECAAHLAELAESKTVVGYSDGLCCSAGYYLACYAHEFHASPSASVGNIGTVLAALDNSREWEMKGWRLELFASGSLKGIGFDGKQWTDSERDFFRGWMLKKFAEFQAVVKERRPQVSEECFDGRWLDGDIAAAFGLVDGNAMSLAQLVAAAMGA